jgi:hypothetical protein
MLGRGIVRRDHREHRRHLVIGHRRAECDGSASSIVVPGRSAASRGEIVRERRAGSDRYSRTLARVWIGNLDLARMLISAGTGGISWGAGRPWC